MYDKPNYQKGDWIRCIIPGEMRNLTRDRMYQALDVYMDGDGDWLTVLIGDNNNKAHRAAGRFVKADGDIHLPVWWR